LRVIISTLVGLAVLILAGFSTFFDYYTGIQIEKANLKIAGNFGFG
jgi:hypothetical protein